MVSNDPFPQGKFDLTLEANMIGSSQFKREKEKYTNNLVARSLLFFFFLWVFMTDFRSKGDDSVAVDEKAIADGL